jgi:hypothetical protein
MLATYVYDDVLEIVLNNPALSQEMALDRNRPYSVDGAEKP